MNLTDSGAEALVYAIVRLAIKDYECLRYRDQCVAFFKSEYFTALTGVDGQALIERLEGKTCK